MRLLRAAGLIFVAVAVVGCAGTELTPIVPPGTEYVDDQNPVYIPLGRESYGVVFENVISVLNDYGFVVDPTNRYDGRIETQPRTAPGMILFLKPGSPDCYERALSTAQSMRHRVFVNIHPAEQGGYFIGVIVLKELEDAPRPVKSTIGAATFSLDTDYDRGLDVVDANRAPRGWIAKGRDPAMEQEIIRRLKRRM
jgi:hypothetical protein